MSRPSLLTIARRALSQRFVWGSVTLIVISLAVLFCVHPKQETYIRWWGTFLQLFGVAMVYLELREAQVEHNENGIRGRVCKWWRETVMGRVTVKAESSLELSFALGLRGKQRFPIDPSALPEARLQVLESNLSFIDEDLERTQAALDGERRERRDADRVESTARTEAEQRFSAKLQRAETGSFNFNMFGLLWVAIGMLLSGTSPEWAGCIKDWLT